MLNGDAILRASGIKDMTKLMERALLWLHEQQVLTLGKGLTVFRSAMTVHLKPSRAGFTRKDFLPLEEHYRELATEEQANEWFGIFPLPSVLSAF